MTRRETVGRGKSRPYMAGQDKGGQEKSQQDEEQSVTVTLSASGYSLSGDFVLTFADAYGGSWTTRPIDLSSQAKAQTVEDTIESLPNQAFPDVTVSRDTSTSTERKYTITFNSFYDIPPEEDKKASSKKKEKTTTSGSITFTVSISGCENFVQF